MALLSTDVVQLLDKLIVIFQKNPRIVYQCVSSINLLSLTKEGMKYLENMRDLKDHLNQTVVTPTNKPETIKMAVYILKRLGCIVSVLIVC